MASYRRRHREPIEESPTVTPASAAPEPMPAAMPEQEPQSIEQAEREALRQRLAELDRAEQSMRAPAPPQPQQQPALPSHVLQWVQAHPELITNRRNNLRLQLAHEEAVEAGVGLDSPHYISELEKRLGLRDPRPETPAAAARAMADPAAAPMPAPEPRYVPPAGGFVAPPSREPRSLSTGRPINHSEPLTRAEAEVAAACGLTADQYRKERDRMHLLKASGAIQS